MLVCTSTLAHSYVLFIFVIKAQTGHSGQTQEQIQPPMGEEGSENRVVFQQSSACKVLGQRTDARKEGSGWAHTA